jgi:chromosome segregation ATPase
VNDKLANANGTITALKNRISQQNKQLSLAQTDVRTATKRADDAEKEVKQLQDAVAVGRGYLSALARVLYRLSEVIQEAVSALIARVANMDRAYRNSFTPGQANAVNAGLNEIPTDRKTAADLLWELAKPGMRGQEPAWIEDAHRSLNELAADEHLVNIDASQQIHM